MIDSLAMSNLETNGRIVCNNRSWFGQNQVGGRNTNTWEVKPVNSMVLDPVQKRVNSSCP
jgi:hypothetical protein